MNEWYSELIKDIDEGIICLWLLEEEVQDVCSEKGIKTTEKLFEAQEELMEITKNHCVNKNGNLLQEDDDDDYSAQQTD